MVSSTHGDFQMIQNPYSPPDAESPILVPKSAITAATLCGMIVSMLFGVLYMIVFCKFISELVFSQNRFAIVDYVRIGMGSAVSAVFAAVSIAATINFWYRRRIALWLFLMSPILLVVFLFPNPNTVWDFVARLLGI